MWRVVTIVVIASLDRFQTQPIREIPFDRATVTSGVCGSMVAAAARADGIDVEQAVSGLP